MTDELKPVKCGCGGEPVVGHLEKTSYVPDRWYIGCPKCDICTGLYNTEAEVIEAWNKAMGERTAKVLNDGVNYCENCEGYVESPMAYCPYCGCRLEWE